MRLIDQMKKSGVINLDITVEHLLKAAKLIGEDKERPDVSSDSMIFMITRLRYITE